MSKSFQSYSIFSFKSILNFRLLSIRHIFMYWINGLYYTLCQEADALPEIMADSDTCLSAANTDIITILSTILFFNNHSDNWKAIVTKIVVWICRQNSWDSFLMFSFWRGVIFRFSSSVFSELVFPEILQIFNQMIAFKAKYCWSPLMSTKLNLLKN